MAENTPTAEPINALPGRIGVGTHAGLVAVAFEESCTGFGLEPAMAATMALAIVNAAASLGYDWSRDFEAARAAGKLVDPAAAAPRRWGKGQTWGQPPADDTPS